MLIIHHAASVRNEGIYFIVNRAKNAMISGMKMRPSSGKLSSVEISTFIESLTPTTSAVFDNVLAISIRDNAGSHDTNNTDRYVFYKVFPNTLRFDMKDSHQKLSIISDF